MLDSFALAAIAGTFILGGAVKGVVGFGLPTVSLALLTVAFGLPQAMALMLAPAFVSNVWQAFSGGGTHGVLRPIWPFLLLYAVTAWLGALARSRIHPNHLPPLRRTKARS